MFVFLQNPFKNAPMHRNNELLGSIHLFQMASYEVFLHELNPMFFLHSKGCLKERYVEIFFCDME